MPATAIKIAEAPEKFFFFTYFTNNIGIAKKAWRIRLKKAHRISILRPRSAPSPTAIRVSPSPKARVLINNVPKCAKSSKIKYPAISPKMLSNIVIEPRCKILYKSPSAIKI